MAVAQIFVMAMLRRMRALLVALGLLAGVCAGASALEVRLAIGEYPPYKVQSQVGGGVLTEIVVEAFKARNINAMVEWVPNNRAIAGTMAGYYDGSFGWAHNAERDEALLFSSKPIYSYKMVFVQRADENHPWNQLSDLASRRIAVTRGNFYSQAFSDLQEQKAFEVDVGNEDVHGLNKLLLRRVDLFPLEESVANHLIATRFEPAERAQFLVQKKEFWTVPIFFVISRKSPNARELMGEFDAGYAELQRSKRLDALLKKLQVR